MKRSIITAAVLGCSLFAACSPNATDSSPSAPASSAASPSATAAPTTAATPTPTASPSTGTPTQSPSTPAATADPFASAYLMPGGFGPVKVGMTKQQLIDGGWGRAYEAGGAPGIFCPGAKQTDALTARGIFFVNNAQGTLQAIGTRSSSVKTVLGVTVGTTLDQLKTVYGSDLVETQSGFQSVETAYVVKGGNNTALFFFVTHTGTPAVDSMYAVNQQTGGIDHGTDNC